MNRWNLLFAALILTSITTLQAQISIGARVGYQLSSVYTTDGLGAVAPNFLDIDEANVGVVLEVPVAGGFSFQPELAYTTKGFGLTQGFDAEVLGVELPLNAMAETRVRYFEMPLLAKYKFGDQAFKAYVAAGPALSYATSGQVDTKVNALLELDLGSVNVDLDAINYERFDISATAGFGVEYDFGPVAAFADARYTKGFSELYDIPVVEEKVRNKAYGFNIGVMFELAK